MDQPDAPASLPPVLFADPPRAVLGCIQIATDFVLDGEGSALAARFPGVELRLQKLRMDSEAISADTFQRAAARITEAASTLLPTERLTVLGLSCTSMSFTLGPAVVDERLSAAAPHARTTDMARGQSMALRALGASKVALVTPYGQAVAAANVDMLRREGFVVVSRATMGLERDEQTSLVSTESIAEWAEAVDCEGADAVVIGCSAFRACGPDFIDRLEKRLGKPVVTSTQAFIWSMLRTAGIEDKISGYGRLFAEH